MKFTHATPVTVSLTDLQQGTVPFSTLLSAFGPSSLGILVVTDLPDKFAPLRQRVLSNASRIAHLPAQTLASLTNPAAKYLVGWSHGVETLRPGVVDTAKGSYYINCAFYKDSALDGADGAKFPGFEEYTAPNVWPPEEEDEDEDADAEDNNHGNQGAVAAAMASVPGFRADAEDLIKLIIDTAVLVARACDRFAESEIEGYESGYLERMVQQSETTKARLLHYFPTGSEPEAEPAHEPEAAKSNGPAVNGTTSDGEKTPPQLEIDDSWCSTHLDHGCLTGLTSAMFVDESSGRLDELPSSPDPSSGLYILSRSQEIHKVGIPRGALAFQTGEALELITGGRFKAVPHFVRGVDANSVQGKGRIARNTLAVFTQPNLDEVVDLKTRLTFGEFARGVVKKNTAS
ncbi:hypothetical protein G647_04598 [Cladophialophora carrionii CBS 160.54]|uniref:Clavaminate synthase-like protein n=1 Tax=Cladophialophora carrionii CBS 160.54 TaxID=1279043 RepID=V9DEE3_9EURO|nr:uncharacterized protein G647_04598 [Cladophialophora carrionii CBS 160.54]ETI25225.1 hypothetical protein G647_04598 [Cladophialophora carrionii CBS 160.54]